MKQIKITTGQGTFNFAVSVNHDDTAGKPWEEEGHGPVSDWVMRPKRAGERVLDESRRQHRYYDFAAAVKIALRDGWNTGIPEDIGLTRFQMAAKAAQADFEWMKAWCDDEWEYVDVMATVLNNFGEETEVQERLGGVHSHNSEAVANMLAQGLATNFGKTWGVVQRPTFAYLPVAKGEV